MPMRRGLIALIVVLAAFSRGNASGQESDTLLRETTGYLLLERGGSGIEAIQFPTLKKTMVRAVPDKNERDFATIHSISDPDSEGRIAYVEDHFFVKHDRDKRHELKIIRLDGTRETMLFSRPDAAMWAASAAGKGQIGNSLALSRVGGRVAFHTGLTPIQMPDHYLTFGSIEIRGIDGKKSIKVDARAINAPMEWFPDGKRLAYVKLADPKVVRPIRGGVFGKEFRDWDKIPSVYIADVDAGTEAFFHVGVIPLISPDGRFMLIGDYEGAWVRVDVATGESDTVTWHDRTNEDARVISYLAKDIVLVSTVAWKPQPKRFGLLSSLDPQIPIRTYRLARLNSDEFQTLSTNDFK